MQADRSGIGQGYPGERGVKSPSGEHRQERRKKCPANALPGKSRIDIDRDIAGSGIGRPGAMLRSIGLAQDRTIPLDDQPGMTFAITRHAPCHFGCVRRLDLETGPAVGHERPVDLRAPGRIALRTGRTNLHA